MRPESRESSQVGKRVIFIGNTTGNEPESIYPSRGTSGTIIDDCLKDCVGVMWDNSPKIDDKKGFSYSFKWFEFLGEMYHSSSIKTMTRKSLLGAAEQIITCDREKQYGSPEDNLGRIARHWSVYMDTEITAHDVSILMTLLKIARIESGQVKEDNYVDGIGYLACAGEIVGGEK